MDVISGLLVFLVALLLWQRGRRNQSTPLADAIATSKPVLPPIPSGRRVQVEPNLADKEKAPKSLGKPDTSLAGMAFFIVYRAANGHESERRITIQKINRKGDDLYIAAFCHERQARRSFYASRIQEMTDIGTNEVVPNPREHLQMLMGEEKQLEQIEVKIRAAMPELPEKPKDSLSVVTKVVSPSLAERLQPIQAEIIALIYMARADGRMVKAERKAGVEYIVMRMPELKGQEADIDVYLSRQYPDKELFADVIGKILSLPSATRAKMYVALDAVMTADGKMIQEELSMLTLYREALQRHSAA